MNTVIVMGTSFAVSTSLRANGSRERAPDDRLREAIQRSRPGTAGLLRRYAPRNDDGCENIRLLDDDASVIIEA
jgi:hypothetical protein